MAGHEAKWAQQPDFHSESVGQYYCSKCKLELDIWYNQNRANEFCTGWHWRIRDDGGHGRSDYAGGAQAKYIPDVEALAEVRREGLERFDSFPCLRSN